MADERFGPWRLAERQSADRLGALYRAVPAEPDSGPAQPVLLRLFQVAGLRPGTLRDQIRELDPEATLVALGPGISPAVAVGEVEDVGFAVFPYQRGRTLVRVAEAARQSFLALPFQDAVLIAERIAKGLGLLHRAEGDGPSPFHGFLVPELVLLTHEGETKLLGYESALGLARAAVSGELGQGLQAYLSPEVLRGEAPEASDDVYALGAILWELLTGRQVPIGGLDEAELASGRSEEDDAPLPRGLLQLIAGSLAPRGQRIGSAAAWHRQLGLWLASEELKISNFDLTVLMRQLFREEWKEEKKLRQTLEASPPPDPEAPSPPSPDEGLVAEAEAEDDVEAVSGAVPVAAPAAEHQRPSRSPASAAWGLAAAALIASVGVFVWNITGERRVATEVEPAVTAVTPAAPDPGATTLPPQPTAPAADPQPGEAELPLPDLTEIDRLVEEQVRDLEDRLSSEVEQEVERLQQQLRETQALHRVEPETQLVEAIQPPPPPPVAPAADPAADVLRGAGSPLVPPPSRPPSSIAEGRGERSPARGREAAVGTNGETSPPPPPRRRVAPRAALPPPPPPPVESEVHEPELVAQPPLKYPRKARRLNKEASAVVRVLVDRRGNVAEVELLRVDLPGFGFEEAALEAARAAEYRPGRRGHVPVTMWTEIEFRFRLE